MPEPSRLLREAFHLDQHGTTVPRELRAGLVTFLTLGYIMRQPRHPLRGRLAQGGRDDATILTVILGTALMGLFAKRPFAVAPLMGENAFVAISVCVVLGYSWQTALAGILISSSLVTILSAHRRPQVPDGGHTSSTSSTRSRSPSASILPSSGSTSPG